MDFETLMALEPHGPDTFVGIGPRYPWGGLYGGQIVAQGLRAAGLTVGSGFRVHSLHAYFIRRGDDAEPIRFEVDRVRNGRSYATRNVIARQAVGAILSMSASFSTEQDGPSAQPMSMPDVPGPEASASDGWSPMFERRWVPGGRRDGKAIGWLRNVDAVPGDDPVLDACALAYLSDDLPTDAIATLHPDDPTDAGFDNGDFWSASLDHAIYFHRPLAAHRWHLQDFTCHAYAANRGLAIGHVFTAEGIHAATISQEVLLRGPRR